MRPYYEDDLVTLYNADAREVITVPFLHEARCAVVTDPPYPNNAGHFDDSMEDTYEVLARVDVDALVFWNELARPPVSLPLVAIHIWHRTNVNGRPYEAIYHFAPDGRKRRSCVYPYGVFFSPVGKELHPTRKPVPVIQHLVAKTSGIVVDPFAGWGSTLRAAKNLGRKAIGIEIEERWCELAAESLAQEVLPVGGGEDD